MPAALLTDVGENPVLMCIVLDKQDRKPFDLIAPREFEHWVWDMNGKDTVSPLSTRSSQQRDASVEDNQVPVVASPQS